VIVIASVVAVADGKGAGCGHTIEGESGNVDVQHVRDGNKGGIEGWEKSCGKPSWSGRKNGGLA
jgi:hypothetical protein